MDSLFEQAGLWLAAAYAAYGFVFLLIPALTFAHVGLLGFVVAAMIGRARGREPWRSVPAWVRRWGRLGLEIVFGLINPLLYLVVFAASLPAMRRDADEWWMTPLLMAAWTLFLAFWTMRVFGGALERRWRAVRPVVIALLGCACLCVLVFAVKDVRLLESLVATEGNGPSVLSIVIRVSPLYLIPLALLLDYLRTSILATDEHRLAQTGSASEKPGAGSPNDTGLFLLRDHAARALALGIAAAALVTVAAGLFRSSDGAVQRLVRAERRAIAQAAARYDVDPRLVAAIVYVTHRDQLSPFRGALERMAVGMWTLGYWPAIGANETLLNRPLDVSIGMAQIKPRTAQTATLLAAGRAFGEASLVRAAAYRDGEPVGDEWRVLPVSTEASALPIAVPASRRDVVRALLDPRSNLELCALILSLYQRQWEAANPAWSLRRKPEILATLYQVGFARSKPHAAPRSNAFGDRVRAVAAEPWLEELFAQGTPASFEKIDVCARVPGAKVAEAVKGRLLDARPINMAGLTAGRCVYGVEIAGARHAIVLWMNPPDDYEGLRKAAEGAVTPISGVGDMAHQTFDADTKRYWLRAVARGRAAIQVSGERPEWLRAVAVLALSTP